ncbi:dendritic cell-specific transmembrane protein [Pelodytes ibericus]
MDMLVSEKKKRCVFEFGLLFLCSLLGLAIGAVFFLILHLSSLCSSNVAWSISGSLGVVTSILAFLSRRIRCLSLLFILSCVTNKGRNALIAAGTGIVVLHNVKNILKNLKNLTESLACNLEAKRLSINIYPLDTFVEILNFIHKRSHQFFIPVQTLVLFSDTFECKITVSDQDIKTVLNQTNKEIQNASDKISSLLDIASLSGNFIILLLSISFVLLGSWLFLRRFLGAHGEKFDNVYITKQFVHYDNCRRLEHSACVLPLSKKEKKDYIIIPSLTIAQNQKKTTWLFFLPVFTNIFLWSLLGFLDFVFYWLIFTIIRHLQEIPPLVVPVSASFYVSIQLIFNIHTLNTKFSDVYNRSIRLYLFEPKCFPKPTLSLSDSWIPLSVIIVVLFILGTFSSFLIQVKMLVVMAFYPEKDLKRIRYLHDQILARRSDMAARKAKKSISTTAFRASFWFPILKMKYSELIHQKVQLSEGYRDI